MRQRGLFCVAVLAGAFVVAGCGASTYRVVHGPDSCRVALRGDSAFGEQLEGAVFDWDHDYLALGLLATSGQPTQLQTLWAVPGLVDATMSAGNPIEVALEDGRVIHVRTRAANASRRFPHSNRHTPPSFTQWNPNADLTDDELVALSESPVVAIRTHAPAELQFAVPLDASARLQTLAICLASPSRAQHASMRRPRLPTTFGTRASARP